MNAANEGTWDRGVRMIGGTLLLAAGWSGLVASGILGLVLSAVGFVVLATGFVGWCPAYTVFGISTRTRPAGHCPTCDSGQRA
jgi:hypothetical protein